MVVALFHKIAFSGIAAAIAAGASLVTSAVVEPGPAYGAQATKLEIDAAGRQAARIFDRADMNKDGALDSDEYSILTVVSAELAQLNGFVAIDAGRGVETIPVANFGGGDLSSREKARIRERAAREFRVIAGDDERLAEDEFIGAQLEQFLSSDKNRDGILAGGELATFAFTQSKLPGINS